jgi:hypothetical protein
MRFTSFTGRMTGSRIGAFLKKLHTDDGRPIIGIADKPRYYSGMAQSNAKVNEAAIPVIRLLAQAPLGLRGNRDVFSISCLGELSDGLHLSGRVQLGSN